MTGPWASSHLEEEALLAHLCVPLLGHCNTGGSQVQASLSPSQTSGPQVGHLAVGHQRPGRGLCCRYHLPETIQVVAGEWPCYPERGPRTALNRN